jgi:serine/threonine protein kinase
LDRLGAGSFGTVFKVKRYENGVTYVIKSVRIVELSYKEQSEAINEVTILAAMDSSYVVRYYDSFIASDSLHIVMEYCDRGDLQHFLKKAKGRELTCLKEHVTWHICLQVILGLYYLHKKKILHRDLKSANVFLMKDKNNNQDFYIVKIGDLGVAKLLDTSTAFAKTIVGTPYYLSPELCSDQPYRDKSDCWALGVLMYECCTLHHPFEARNQCALIMKIVQAQFSLPDPETTSPELSQLISWVLQKDPVDRPSIKQILNEKHIRDKLDEHRFDLPAELLEHQITFQLTPELDPSTLDKAPNLNEELSDQKNYKENILTSSSSTHKSSQFSKTKPKKLISSSSVSSLDRDPTGEIDSIVVNGVNKYNINNNNKDKYVQSARLISNPNINKKELPLSGVRGDRVRGPNNKGRIMSEKALIRHQVRIPMSASTITVKSTHNKAEEKEFRNDNNDSKRVLISDNDLKANSFQDRLDQSEDSDQAETFRRESKAYFDTEENDKTLVSDAKYTQSSFYDNKEIENRGQNREEDYDYDDFEDYEDEEDETEEDKNNITKIEYNIRNDEEEIDNNLTAEDQIDRETLDNLIDDARGKLLVTLGEDLFRKVYNLCFELISVTSINNDPKPIENNTQALLKKLEEILSVDIPDGVETRCNIVFGMRMLISFESELDKLDEDKEIKRK